MLILLTFSFTLSELNRYFLPVYHHPISFESQFSIVYSFEPSIQMLFSINNFDFRK